MPVTRTSTHSPWRGDLFNTSLALASPGGIEVVVVSGNASPVEHRSSAKLRREVFMSQSFPEMQRQSRKKPIGKSTDEKTNSSGREVVLRASPVTPGFDATSEARKCGNNITSSSCHPSSSCLFSLLPFDLTPI